MARLGITSGIRGFFAVLYDADGPIQTGIGSYENEQGAIDEALSWWVSEGKIHSLDKKIIANPSFRLFMDDK